MGRLLLVSCLLALPALVAGCRSHKAERVDRYLVLADESLARNRPDEALEHIERAISVDPSNSTAYVYRGRLETAGRQFKKAMADFNQAIDLNKRNAEAYDERGDLLMRMGEPKEALADFDRFVRLRPQLARNHWRRAIACYYAGDYEQGVKQFESCASVEKGDVENLLWRFLCIARLTGLENARATMPPYPGDPRVPMQQIYNLYMGKGTADAVLAAANAPNVPPEEQRRRLFRAHLYLGLLAEATDRAADGMREIDVAARDFALPDFMGDLARMHVPFRNRQAGGR